MAKACFSHSKASFHLLDAKGNNKEAYIDSEKSCTIEVLQAPLTRYGLNCRKILLISLQLIGFIELIHVLFLREFIFKLVSFFSSEANSFPEFLISSPSLEREREPGLVWSK